jgi:hypothetical protein
VLVAQVLDVVADLGRADLAEGLPLEVGHGQAHDRVAVRGARVLIDAARVARMTDFCCWPA